MRSDSSKEPVCSVKPLRSQWSVSSLLPVIYCTEEQNTPSSLREEGSTLTSLLPFRLIQDKRTAISHPQPLTLTVQYSPQPHISPNPRLTAAPSALGSSSIQAPLVRPVPYSWTNAEIVHVYSLWASSWVFFSFLLRLHNLTLHLIASPSVTVCSALCVCV